MKTLLRIAAVLSFGFCFAGGFLIFCLAAAHLDSPDAALIAAVGLVLVGLAFFTGAMVWMAAEKICSRRESEGQCHPSSPI